MGCFGSKTIQHNDLQRSDSRTHKASAHVSTAAVAQSNTALITSIQPLMSYEVRLLQRNNQIALPPQSRPYNADRFDSRSHRLHRAGVCIRKRRGILRHGLLKKKRKDRNLCKLGEQVSQMARPRSLEVCGQGSKIESQGPDQREIRVRASRLCVRMTTSVHK
jgi:hypothetical protein